MIDSEFEVKAEEMAGKLGVTALARADEYVGALPGNIPEEAKEAIKGIFLAGMKAGIETSIMAAEMVFKLEGKDAGD